MKVLHVLRSNDDRVAQQMIEEIGRVPDTEQTLLLMQDGVYIRREGPRVFACADDVEARGVSTVASLVDYDRIVDMILESDRVMTW